MCTYIQTSEARRALEDAEAARNPAVKELLPTRASADAGKARYTTKDILLETLRRTAEFPRRGSFAYIYIYIYMYAGIWFAV